MFTSSWRPVPGPGSQVRPGRGRDLCVSVALCSGWCPVQDHTLKTAAGGFGESRVLMERVVVLRWTSKVKSSSSRVPGLGPCTRGTRSSGEKRSFGVLRKFAFWGPRLHQAAWPGPGGRRDQFTSPSLCLALSVTGRSTIKHFWVLRRVPGLQ